MQRITKGMFIKYYEWKNPNSKEAGRPTKESQGESVTEKTIQNQEAKS